jgi:hypothetical protein
VVAAVPDAQGGVTLDYRLNVGNLVAAGTVLVTITMFILSIRSSAQLEVAELRARLEVSQTKLEQLQREFNDYRTATLQYNSDMRTSVGAVSNQISDIRVLIAQSLQSKGGR